MKPLSRRDVLKTGLLAPVAVAAANGMGPFGVALNASGENAEALAESITRQSSGSALDAAGRERLLLDFGWRFHFGNADDPAKDFGFGSGRAGNFQKTGNFMPAGSLPSTTATGAAWICHTTGPSSCLSQNDPALQRRDSTRWGGRIRRRASAGTGESSIFRRQTRASG